MYLCYVDESGTPDTPGNTSHFILAGLSIPINRWKECDKAIQVIKRKYNLENTEIHVAWILRPYFEQSKISNFENLDYTQRRFQVQQFRTTELLRLQKVNNQSDRVSRLLMVTNDGSPRFYRELEFLHKKHGTRVMICRLDIGSVLMGNILGLKDKQVKAVLLNRKNSVVNVLKSLL